MNTKEQLALMSETIKALKEMMPLMVDEKLLFWIQRGLNEGLLTLKEHEVLTRIIVYDRAEFERVVLGA